MERIRPRPRAGVSASGGRCSHSIAGVTAREVGWTKARLNEFIKGKRGVTAEAVLDLAEALGTSPRLWINLQATLDLEEATRRRKAASGRFRRKFGRSREN